MSAISKNAADFFNRRIIDLIGLNKKIYISDPILTAAT